MERAVRRLVVAGLALIVGSVLTVTMTSSRAEASDPIRVDSLLLSLLQVQDRIARGDVAALPLQKHLMTLLDAGIAEAGHVEEMTPAEFRALIIFGIVGTGSGAVIEALQEVKTPELNHNLARAVIDYRERKRNQATKRFSAFELDELDSRLVPFVAFAKGNLYSRKAPKKAVRQYDLVRLSAPGTLLEEASLRRLMSLHASYSRGVPFTRIAKQYARRFINSPYRKQYLSMLRGGILSMRRSIPLEEVGEMGELMPPVYAISFHMHLVRSALESGYLKLAKYSITKIGSLSAENKSVQVNQEQLKLFQLLAAMTTQEPNTLIEQLATLDEGRLAKADMKLLKRARGILGYIVAPIDEVKTNSITPSQPMPKISLPEVEKMPAPVNDASSSPTSSGIEEGEEKQTEIDQFIGRTQKRLSDIDSMLSE